MDNVVKTGDAKSNIERCIIAKPQVENGHVDIANEIAEALCFINLSAYESRILWALWRKTYGWHKKSDRISYTQWEQLTGLKRWHIARTIKHLITRNIITSRGNGYKLEYSFQKDYEQWLSLPKQVTNEQSLPIQDEPLPIGVEPSPIGVMKSLPIGVTTKEKKETIQKKLYKRKNNLPDFIDKELWNAFLEMRRKMRKPPTNRAVSLLLGDLEKYRGAGDDPTEILKQSIKNNWVGVFPLKGGQGGTHRQSPRQLRPRDSYTKPEDL